jgi:hypothetical protein
MSKPLSMERRGVDLGPAGAPSPKRQGRDRRIRTVAVAVLLAVAIGVVGGLMAFRVTHDPLDRAWAADAARWQGQADAWFAQQRLEQALERGRAADAARWQAQADAWLASHSPRAGHATTPAGSPSRSATSTAGP